MLPSGCGDPGLVISQSLQSRDWNSAILGPDAVSAGGYPSREKVPYKKKKGKQEFPLWLSSNKRD